MCCTKFGWRFKVTNQSHFVEDQTFRALRHCEKGVSGKLAHSFHVHVNLSRKICSFAQDFAVINCIISGISYK